MSLCAVNANFKVQNGLADALIAVIAIAVLLISVVLMFLFVAKVYETLILHTGNRIKMKEVFAMLKTTKKGKEAAGDE